jgi:peptidoglycan/xylan/chitin deacetylase (PgdA/CDA1 family)
MSGGKARLRAMLCGAYRHSGAAWLHERVAHALGQQFMTVLVFHRVTDAIPEDGLTVGARRFRAICEMLARRFRVVPLGEVFRIRRAGEPMPRRTVAITFDDCYRDNLAAARVLKEYGLPATFFVPTGFVGADRPFDWDRHLPPMPHLTWDEVREMADLGFEIGSHTVSHCDLGAVGLEEACRELFASRQTLMARLDRPVRWFAYPFGGPQHLRPEYVPLIAEAGYEGAVSAYGGFVTPDCDARVLPREAAPYFRSLAHLEMHLSGCLHWLYALRGRRAPDHAGDRWAYPDHLEAKSRHELFAPAER